MTRKAPDGADLSNAILLMRNLFHAAGLDAPSELRFKTFEDGHRFEMWARNDPVLGLAMLDRRLVRDGPEPERIVEICGLKITWPARAFTLRDGSVTHV